jgi:hypothetical protein
MASNQKLIDAVRTVGYLLETNGTRNTFARNKRYEPVDACSPKACRWCLAGAIIHVSDRMKVPYLDVKAAVIDMVYTTDPLYGTTISFWDNGTASNRKQLVRQLKNYDNR